MRALAPIESHEALSRHNLHAFRRRSLEVIRTRTNQTEGLLRLIGHKHRVADDVAIEIDIRLRLNGNAGELRRKRGHESLMSVTSQRGKHVVWQTTGHTSGFGEPAASGSTAPTSSRALG